MPARISFVVFAPEYYCVKLSELAVYFLWTFFTGGEKMMIQLPARDEARAKRIIRRFRGAYAAGPHGKLIVSHAALRALKSKDVDFVLLNNISVQWLRHHGKNLNHNHAR